MLPRQARVRIEPEPVTRVSQSNAAGIVRQRRQTGKAGAPVFQAVSVQIRRCFDLRIGAEIEIRPEIVRRSGGNGFELTVVAGYRFATEKIDILSVLRLIAQIFSRQRHGTANEQHAAVQVAVADEIAHFGGRRTGRVVGCQESVVQFRLVRTARQRGRVRGGRPVHQLIGSSEIRIGARIFLRLSGIDCQIQNVVGTAVRIVRGNVEGSLAIQKRRGRTVWGFSGEKRLHPPHRPLGDVGPQNPCQPADLLIIFGDGPLRFHAVRCHLKHGGEQRHQQQNQGDRHEHFDQREAGRSAACGFRSGRRLQHERFPRQKSVLKQ